MQLEPGNKRLVWTVKLMVVGHHWISIGGKTQPVLILYFYISGAHDPVMVISWSKGSTSKSQTIPNQRPVVWSPHLRPRSNGIRSASCRSAESCKSFEWILGEA